MTAVAKPGASRIDWFVVLDFDRCLGDTEKLQSLFEEVIAAQTSRSVDQLREDRRRTEADGGSFDPVTNVQEVLEPDDSQLHELLEQFIRLSSHEDMLNPGARALLAALDDEGIPYGIVTYGGYLWQAAKLAAAGLNDLPTLITETKEKGRLMVDWWSEEDSGFILPAELLKSGSQTVAARLTLVDDKAVSFVDLPPKVDGIRVRIGKDLLPAQQGVLPSTVSVAYGLEEVQTRLLGAIVDKT